MKANSRSRPDEDIEEEINDEARKTPLLKAARSSFSFRSTNGSVKVSGNCGSPQAKSVLLGNIQGTPGVTSVDMTDLYDDEKIRESVARMIPEGIRITVRFGNVLLDSTRPGGTTNNSELLRTVRAAHGARQVMMSYQGVEIKG